MNGSQFNESDYLAANPDVAAAVKRQEFNSGYEHYVEHGEKEGRMLKLKRLFSRVSRENKVLHLIDKSELGLEIGPSHNPVAPKSKGFNVHILDHMSAEGLRKKYQGHDVNLDNIEDVDFVWHGEPFPELIGEEGCYEWIIASHLIEHVPDLISFIQQCETLLTPNGVLSLVIPDKRYCFDYFSPGSTTGSVLDAYDEKRKKPSSGQVFDHFANAAKRKGGIAWGREDFGEPDELMHTFVQAQGEWDRSVLTEDYIDTHCWRFTPNIFRLILSDLQKLGLTCLGIVQEFDTEGCEFFVTLKKGFPLLNINRLELLKKTIKHK